MTAPTAVFSMNTPESIVSRSLPDPRMVRPRTTASGAKTLMTLPLPGPTRIAPGSPSTVTLRAIRIAPRCSPAFKTTTSPSAAPSTTSWGTSPGETMIRSAKAGTARLAANAAASPNRRMVRMRPTLSGRLWLDKHAALHLHVHRVAEPGAVIPVDSGLAGSECNRRRLLRPNFHVDAVVDDAEAMSQVLNIVDVGHVNCDLVTLFDLKTLQAECRRGRGHVDSHLVAVADHLRVGLQGDAVGLGLLHRIGEERVVSLPHMERVDLRAVHDRGVVRLSEARAIMHQHHTVARDVDELIVLGLERADVEEPVLRELIQRNQPLAIRFLGLAHGRVIVARL